MRGPRGLGRVLAAVCVVAGASSVVGCGSDGGDGPVPNVAAFALGRGEAQEEQYVLTPEPQPQDDEAGEPSFEPTVAWVNDGEYLAVVTWGSSTCPTTPYVVDVAADQELDIEIGLLYPDRDPCTADLSPHVTVLELPSGISPSAPLLARFDGTEVTIDAVG